MSDVRVQSKNLINLVDKKLIDPKVALIMCLNNMTEDNVEYMMYHNLGIGDNKINVSLLPEFLRKLKNLKEEYTEDFFNFD